MPYLLGFKVIPRELGGFEHGNFHILPGKNGGRIRASWSTTDNKDLCVRGLQQQLYHSSLSESGNSQTYDGVHFWAISCGIKVLALATSLYTFCTRPS